MIRSILLSLVLVASGLPLNAHPHIFVDANGSFIFNDKQELVAVRIYWLYDEYSTLFIYESQNLDEDGDGELSAADLEKVKLGETIWQAGYEGDTYLWIGGEQQKLSRPTHASAEEVAGRIGVSFELRLETPQIMAGQTARLKLYDPSYYYAYSIPGEGLLYGNAPACQTWVDRPDQTAQMAELQAELNALSQEETPEDMNIGARFAEDVVLQCD
ncbi:MAG TPA: DUF1007 family protein [Rhodobacteraceae bacterium]|nr:DUF1007 family protein [Paracoccaceae bacterium]